MNLLACCVLLLGSVVGGLAALPGAAAEAPGLMHASRHAAGIDDVRGYWISEKLDGVRGRWDGRRLRTRGGMPVVAPAWFTAHWPAVPMDGELWIARGNFEQVSGLVRRADPKHPAWRRTRFMVFDLPGHPGHFAGRVLGMRALLADPRVPWLRPVPQWRVGSQSQLDRQLREVVAAGGEGLMLHHQHAIYRVGRSDLLRKYKPHDDAEARVVGYTAGKGKYAGQVGALRVVRADGLRFRIGSGLSDADRRRPPPIGSLVTYRYNGLTANGTPRFARYLRIRRER